MSELPPTVFMVDDDATVLEPLKGLMESVQLRTEIYTSAQDFLQNYDRARLGCLILDLRLPGVSGLGLHRQLREEGSDIPVIYLTGYADIATAVSAMRDGAFDFVEKPGRSQYLVTQVQAAITAHQEAKTRARSQRGLCECDRRSVASLVPARSEAATRSLAEKRRRTAALPCRGDIVKWS